MSFKSITIFQRPGDLSSNGKHLLDDVKRFGERWEIPVVNYDPREPMWLHNDSLFVAIGGDGTMLRAMDVSIQSTLANKLPTCVVGFNAGNVGFLTEDNKHPFAMLSVIYHEEDTEVIRLDERMALSVMLDGKEHFALNEFAFTPENISAPLTYKIGINGKFVAEYMGSGCAVSTPTGSTALALSAGGSIITPEADVMQVVPLISHTLTSRPVVTSGNDVITLSSDMERIDKVIVSSDGRVIGSFENGAEIKVQKARAPAYVWYARNRDFFNILSTKLDW